MTLRDTVIGEEDAATIKRILTHFLGESGAGEVLLIDRSGQPLAIEGVARTLDTVGISALAAAAFSSTGAMAQLLGETEFTVLFHEGRKRSIHVSTVDEQAILLAIFDEKTTVGMVRLFARETSKAVAAVLAFARAHPARTGAFAAPLGAEAARPLWGQSRP